MSTSDFAQLVVMVGWVVMGYAVIRYILDREKRS